MQTDKKKTRVFDCDNSFGGILNMRDLTWKKTMCPYDCPAACGLEVETDGKKIYRVQADPDHPLYEGLICQKMRHYENEVHGPNRILTPLKRVGEKGEGKFEPISWEQAVGEITDRWKEILREDGPDAFVGVSSSGTLGIIQKFCVDALFNKIGARRMVMTLCSGAKEAAYASCTGGRGCLCPTEMKDSDYYIVWGSNVKATRIHSLALLQKERQKGKKVVLIEVCAVDMAQYCDEVVLVRPGSDGALALAMMHVLAKEGLTADEYLKDFASGYEAFKETLPQYTPEWAEAITGVPAETIIRLAREFGHAYAPSILHGTGNTRRGNGGMNARLIMILSAITGAWGRPGGGYAGRDPKPGACVDVSMVSRPDLRTHQGLSANINLLADVLSEDPQIEKTKVKAFYLSGGNPVNSVHDQVRMIEALSRPDLLTVVHERYITDTALYADYILPATFSVERTECHMAIGYCAFGTSMQVIDPPGECRSNWDTIGLLARAMGFEDEQFRMTEKEMLDRLLEHPGPALKDVTDTEWKTLKEGGVVRLPYVDHTHFPTPDGKFRIIDENQEQPMPCYLEDFPDDKEKWPLSLVAVPSSDTLNSVFFGRPDLIEKRGKMLLLMNPQDAEDRGIKDGDSVLVKNDLAEVAFTACLTDLTVKGCVASTGVYDRNQSGQKLQLNALHHGRISDIGAGTTLNGNRVEVSLREENASENIYHR